MCPPYPPIFKASSHSWASLAATSQRKLKGLMRLDQTHPDHLPFVRITSHRHGRDISSHSQIPHVLKREGIIQGWRSFLEFCLPHSHRRNSACGWSFSPWGPISCDPFFPPASWWELLSVLWTWTFHDLPFQTACGFWTCLSSLTFVKVSFL